MSSAHLFISVSGDGTMNHVIWMNQGAYVLELVPFAFTSFDQRVLKVYREAGRWIGLDHAQIEETTGPACPQEGDKCRAFYRKRKMVANVTRVVDWFVEHRHELTAMATAHDHSGGSMGVEM